MTERTTISITKELKRELDDLKVRNEESYEHLLWRLVKSESGVDEETIYAARDEVVEAVTTRDDYATEEHMGELADKLDRIERLLEQHATQR